MSPRIVYTLIAFVLAMLTASPRLHADVFTNDDVVTDPTPNHFSVCHGHGCATVKTVGMNPTQWQILKTVFKYLPRTPALERERIRKAIAILESYTGVLAGTSQDKGGDIVGLGLPGQMDCIDEATNTSLYLTLLKNSGLIKFHEVEDRATRGFLINGWPHNTAVIIDTVSGERYAVDSWFLDNGEMPFIVPLGAWRSGWKPEDSGRSNPGVISGNR